MLQHPWVLSRLIPDWIADLSMYKPPENVVVQFSESTAISFLKPRILNIARIRTSCRTLEAVFKLAVQKLIADVCVQCHVMPPYMADCSYGIISRTGASAKIAIMRLIEALEHDNTRKKAFGHIPKEQIPAVDDEVWARCAHIMFHPNTETQWYASHLLRCWSGEAPEKLSILRHLEALEHADTQKKKDNELAHIPKERTAAVDEEILARCRQLMLHSDEWTQRCASTLLQCWNGEAHCSMSGVVCSTRGGNTLVTYTVRSDQQESDPLLKAIISLENALANDRTLDDSILASVLELVQQSPATSAQELPSILSGLEGRGHEFHRSAWRLCKLARKCCEVATRSRSRSRGRFRNRKGGRNKGKSTSKGFGGVGRGGSVKGGGRRM